MNNNYTKLEQNKNQINEKNDSSNNLAHINIKMNINSKSINIENNNETNKIKDNLKVSNSNKSNYERFYYKNSKIKFHNSVNDPCNIIKKIKVKNLPNPKYISLKLIKQKTKEILKSERNRPRINNY